MNREQAYRKWRSCGWDPLKHSMFYRKTSECPGEHKLENEDNLINCMICTRWRASEYAKYAGWVRRKNNVE